MEANSEANDSTLSATSTAAAAAAASAAAQGDKPRLTEQEKKSNHIASEQKRRQAIREGFDEIADLVPGLKGHGRSEAMVLEGATAFVKKLLAERWRLVVEARSKGMDVSAFEMDRVTLEIARLAAADEDAELEQEDGERYGMAR